jgi:hypothetical protein
MIVNHIFYSHKKVDQIKTRPSNLCYITKAFLSLEEMVHMVKNCLAIFVNAEVFPA